MTLAEILIDRRRTAASPPGTAAAPALVFLGATALLAAAITVAVAGSLEAERGLEVLVLAPVALAAAWIAGGAVTAFFGLAQPRTVARPPPPDWQPNGRTAVLVTLCGEAPEATARYLDALRRGLDNAGLAGATPIFVLSDTSAAATVAREEAAFAPLLREGALSYRRRALNTGRKPGNIGDWLARHGADHDYMLVLDADSRMSPWRIRSLIHRLESRPGTGLLQAGMTPVPAQSRFGRHQRTSSRLLSPNFGRGLAAWAGTTGNYWGHNAIMRVEAFRAAADLPHLSGPAPFGGPPLSHDFVEAAFIRRAGWAVELDPALSGSAEDGPQTLEDFHRRDRRWCQGNLQHIRLLASPGLHPLSRLHLLSGIVGYLASPVWLGLVVLIACGMVTVAGALPLMLVAAVLLVPKLCALAHWLARARTRARRRVIMRAAISEFLVSTLVAPLVMVRQSGAVASVLLGRDCGWKPGQGARRPRLPSGAPEALAGLAILALAVSSVGLAAVWLMPLALPLVGAPFLLRALDAAP